jgi:hypothetical protein
MAMTDGKATSLPTALDCADVQVTGETLIAAKPLAFRFRARARSLRSSKSRPINANGCGIAHFSGDPNSLPRCCCW